MGDLYGLFSSWWALIIPAILVAIELLGLYSAWHAINKVRTSQAAVAWAVGLVGLPFIVLPLYWVIGRTRFAGYRDAIRQVELQHKKSVDAVRRELLTRENVGDATADCAATRLADVLDTPASSGNWFQLLVDGDQFFTTLLQQIRSAKRYIYIEFFIIQHDEIGNKFAEALCERARAGIAVRLLYDEVGCLHSSRHWLGKLREAGVDAHPFNTRQGWVNRFQLNFRNHRKLLIVDGQRAVTGGLNVGDEYLGQGWAEHWRDTGILVEGPASRKMQAVFASDWYWARRQDLPEASWSFSEPDGPETKHRHQQRCAGQAVVCATGPADTRNRATMMFAAVAAESRQRLWISSPYLVPDEPSITALSMARARGVDVRLLIPDRADRWLVYLAGFYYEQLFESMGIPVYRYTRGFLHQKCILVDDALALIGSTNLDNRSLHLNFELMLAVSEPGLVQEVGAMLERDFAHARIRSRSNDRLAPWYMRIGTIIARLFSPVL